MAGNDINLAALWVPVMPETKGLAPAMQKAGEESKKAFAQGFKSSGGGAGSPEQMGAQWGQQFTKSAMAQMSNIKMPDSLQNFMGSLGEKTKVTASQMDSLKSKVQSTYQEWQRAAQAAAPHQQKLIELQHQYNKAIADGDTKFASFVKSRMQFHSTAPEMEKAAKAQANYADATGKLSAVQGSVTKSSQLMSAAMGAGVGIAASVAVSGITALAGALWDMAKGAMTFAIDTAKELALEIIHVGDTYEGLANQVTLYSGAQGAALDELKASTANVYGDLDVDAKDLGKTMANLNTSLGLTGEPLEQLGSHVATLQGRFGSFNTGNFTAAMAGFNQEGRDADTILANLVESARDGGVSIDTITAALARNSAILQEAGLNINQAGKFLADLEAEGVPVSTVLTNLATAQGKFTEVGLTMQEGLAMTKQRLDEYRAAGDRASEKALLIDVFGESGWVNAPALLETINTALGTTADQFDANGQSLDDLEEHTKGLGERWTEVKHQAEEALRPMGEAAVGVIGSALDKLSGFVKEHHDQIIKWVKDIGDKFIETLPAIQAFAVGLIGILGPTIDWVLDTLAAAMEGIGLLAQTAGSALSLIPGMEDKGRDLQLLGLSTQALGDKVKDINVTEGTKKLQKWIADLNIDVPKTKDAWHDMVDEINDSEFDDKQINIGIGGGLGNSLGGPGSPGGTTPFASIPGGPTGGTNPLTTPGLSPTLTIQGPSSTTTAVGGGSPESNKQMAMAMFPFPQSEWPAFDELEMREAGYDQNADNPDSTAYGMGQFLDTTWQQYGFPPTGSPDPATQLSLMFKYIKERYGTPSAALAHHDTHNWYQSGGTIAGQRHWEGAPNSHDTVPIWAEPGEEVINKRSAAKHRALLQYINADKAMGFQSGGQVGVQQVIWANPVSGLKVGEAGGALVGPGTSQPGYYSANWAGHTGHVHTSFFSNPATGEPYGLPKGTDIRQGASGFPSWVYQLGAMYGVEGSTYAGHQETSGYNRGIDWWPKGHADMSGATYTEGERALLDRFASAMASLGVSQATGKTPTMSTSSVSMPTATYGYGGQGPTMTLSGPMQPEDWESAERNRVAIRDQEQRLSDMDYQIDQKRKDIALKEAHLSKLQTDLDVLTKKPKASQEEIDAAAADLAAAQHDLATQTRERGDEETELGTKRRKAAEDALGKPIKGQKRREATGAEIFQDLGGGLLEGLADTLGLGEIFDKPPWEWGIFKLATGLANWGFGTAEGWANEIGKGHTGVTGFQALPGFEEGAQSGSGFSIAGLNIPNVSTGPNVNATNTVPSPGFGQPLGPAPGPVTVDQSLTVNQNGMQRTDVEGMQHARNAQGTVQVQTGNMPKPK